MLACVDDSPTSDAVIRHTLAIAQSLDLAVTLGRVIETPQSLERPTDPLEWQLRRNELRDQLARITVGKNDVPVEMDSILLAGSAADELSGWAEKQGVPLLALATHRQRSLAQAGLGSTVLKVLERGSTSLLLVPASEPDVKTVAYRRLLVPLDGSCQAESVLPLAIRIARAHAAEIVLAHVVPGFAFLETNHPEQHASELRAELASHNERQARAYLDDLRSKLSHEGLVVSAIVASGGDPRAELRRLAINRGVDLIVLSSHGQGGLADVPCGSATEYLATHAPAPMLIVRPNFAHGFGAELIGSSNENALRAPLTAH
jgi:nucleotide-binding universal stress UspA family protein